MQFVLSLLALSLSAVNFATASPVASAAGAACKNGTVLLSSGNWDIQCNMNITNGDLLIFLEGAKSIQSCISKCSAFANKRDYVLGAAVYNPGGFYGDCQCWSEVSETNYVEGFDLATYEGNNAEPS